MESESSENENSTTATATAPVSARGLEAVLEDEGTSEGDYDSDVARRLRRRRASGGFR